MLVAGAHADKPSRLVASSEPIGVTGPPPRFVSRAGEKLDAAIDRFAVVVSERRALDAGASTGGFVDCLLQRGASSVVAVDVGRGQLDPRIRGDRRVVVLEGRNVRSLEPADLGAAGAVDVLTADLSFISLRTVADRLVRLTVAGGDLLLLVKPQFEVGRVEASRAKGVIVDPELWRRAVSGVASAMAAAGTGIMGVMASPIRGAAGNVEFLLHARVGAPHPAGATVAAWLDDAVVSGATIG